MPAPPLRLYNTLVRKVEDVVPVTPDTLTIYQCGMTVYDHCHVGHARAMIVYSTLTRYLRHRGWKVVFVRNITDIDDKILAKAADEGIEPLALADRYIESFLEDVDGLGLIRPDAEPRVSDTLDAIRGMIQDLLDAGHAYVADGTVWFDVRSFPRYGSLSGAKLDGALRSDDPDPGKRDPADFAMWKAARPGEKSWPSPWGPGRPGWHIECSAMAGAALGDEIDIHGGGLDLVFPHHENEIAQSECAHGGTRFVRVWMHNGMVTAAETKAGGRAHREQDGDDIAAQVDQKMGKSKGNAFVIKNALQLVPAEAIRLYYLQTHYRSPLPWSDDALIESLAMLARLYDAREQAERMGGSEPPDDVARSLGKDAMEVLRLGRAFPAAMYAALDEDFNTAKALGLAFELARAINRLANNKSARKRGGPVVAPALEGFDLLGQALGLMTLDTATFQEEVRTKRLAAMGLERSTVEERIAARQAAREAKDWARADQLRDELIELGIDVMDTPAGPTWRVRLG